MPLDEAPPSGSASVGGRHVRPGTRDTPSSAILHRLLLDETTFIHAKPASGQVQLVEIAIVVRYHHHRHAGLASTPATARRRTCAGIPDPDRRSIRPAAGSDASPAGSRCSASRLRWPPDRSSVPNSPSVRRVLSRSRNSRQQPIDLCGVRIGNSIEPLEKMIVNENRRNQRAIGVAVCCR